MRINFKRFRSFCRGSYNGKRICRHTYRARQAGKDYDFASRIQYHIHQMQKMPVFVGKIPKMSILFPEDVDTGAHPRLFRGPSPILLMRKMMDILLPHLEE